MVRPKFLKTQRRFHLQHSVAVVRDKMTVDQTTFRMVVTLILLGVSLRPVAAGDFVLVVDHSNNTIFAGSMSKLLDDSESLPLQGVEAPLALDYDPVENMIYWTQYDKDTRLGKLSRAHLDGSNQMTLLRDLRFTPGLALDVEARMAYWTDRTLGQIRRVPIDGSGTEEIIVRYLHKPWGITIDKGRGHIYWTDLGDNPRVERANLNGTERTVLIDEDLRTPNAVIVNFEANKLYWCDGVREVIEQADLLGNNRELLLNLTMHQGVFHPYDLAIYNDYMFWSDRRVKSLLRVHLDGRGEQHFGPFAFEGVTRIHIQKEPDYCDSSPCHNGATCEDVINGFFCHCPSGFHGQDCSANFCDGEPCSNGGTCTSLLDGFTCSCPAHYYGETCSFVDGCVAPEVPSHATLLEGDVAMFDQGEQVTFLCDNGFSVKGTGDHTARRTCLADGTWSGKPTECSVDSTANPETQKVPVILIASGAGGAVVIIIILIVVFVLIKKRKKNNRPARVIRTQDIPAIAYPADAPPAYVQPRSFVQPPSFVRPPTTAGTNNPTFAHNNTQGDAVNMNTGTSRTVDEQCGGYVPMRRIHDL